MVGPSFQPQSGPVLRWALWLLAAMALAVATMLLSQAGALDPLRAFSLRAAAPAALALRGATLDASDLLTGLLRRDRLLQENEALRQQVERLQAELARRQDASQRLAELERLLQLKSSRPQEGLLGARVLALELGPLRQALAIDRGSDDGLQEGMVVLSEGGSLVGTVSRVYPDHAWVTLVTDPRSAVNVSVQGGQGDARGVVTGRGGLAPALELVPREAAVAEGNLVVTSGLGGRFPPGLLVGVARAVRVHPQDPFVEAQVEPSAPLPRLRAVLVLTTFLPTQLGSP
jgi:rod shape-determining protein MreC